jgi:L-ribulose-5-phosphate 3-epimerase
MTRIGIRDGCLRMAWPEALRTAAELGFDGLEPDVGANWRENPLWAQGPEAVAAMCRETGGTILSFCAGVCWSISPASASAQVRAEIAGVLTELIGFTAQLGATYILVPITPGGEDVSYDDSRARWVEAMKALAPRAQEAGITLALENVGRGCGRSADELIFLVDGVSSPAVKAYYDVGNATAFGFDPPAEIAQLGSRIAAVHVKEREADLLGQGIVKIPESLVALNKVGYVGDLVLETNPTDDPVAAARYNLEYLRGLTA